MPPRTPQLSRIPGLEMVGRGVYIRPSQPYVLKDILFERKGTVAYYSDETGLSYAVPEQYQVDDSPLMPATQALNQVIVEESWDRFEKRTSLDANVAVGDAPFSVDVNAGQTRQLRQDEESYYALRTSFIPLWALYIPNTSDVSDDDFVVDIPVPFSHTHRKAYAKFFERHGTHYIPRAWAGGKATLALTISKRTQITKAEIHAGIKATAIGTGSVSVSDSDAQSRAKVQNNSQCSVFGSGGDELKLAALSTLDEDLYNEWLVSVNHNPEVIEFEAVGIWTLFRDQAKADALKEAYKEETAFESLRALFHVGNTIFFFEDYTYYTYDVEKGVTSKPKKITEEQWSELAGVGFERPDSAFLGKYLKSTDGKDLGRKLFIFNRDMYIRFDVDTNKVDSGYPRLIKDGWPGVDFPRIDAVVNVTLDSVYFFCGCHYIRFNSVTNKADDGYPDLVAKRWSGVTFDRIDAATYWGNGKVYFFRDNQYIRYDTVMWRADAGYPKTIVSHYVEDWKFFE